jgi:hypothetical protein
LIKVIAHAGIFYWKVKNKKNNFIEFLRNDKGSMLLELSLITPILILVIAGIVQFGFILNAKIAVSSAAYEAARMATIAADPYDSAIKAVENYAQSSIPGWSLDERLRADVTLTGMEPGSEVRVDVFYRVPVFFEGIAPFNRLAGSLAEIMGTSMMRIEEKE